MPANGRRDLIRRLKFKETIVFILRTVRNTHTHTLRGRNNGHPVLKPAVRVVTIGLETVN